MGHLTQALACSGRVRSPTPGDGRSQPLYPPRLETWQADAPRSAERRPIWAGEEHFCVRNHHGPGAILLTASALTVGGRRDTSPEGCANAHSGAGPITALSGAVPYSPTTDADGSTAVAEIVTPSQLAFG